MPAGENQSHITGQYGQKIHNTKKAENIIPRLIHTIYAEKVFNGKEKGKKPFYSYKNMKITLIIVRNRLPHDCEDAQHYHDEKNDVKQPSFTGLRFKNDFVQFRSERTEILRLLLDFILTEIILVIFLRLVFHYSTYSFLTTRA
jgi:hypothetical protein